VLETGEGRWGFVVAFSGDGKRLAAGNRRVCVFDLETGKRVAAIEAHDKALTAIALSPDGALLATADTDRRVRVWTVKSGKEARSWTSETSVGALVFSAKAERLGAATYYGGCQIFRLAEPASGN